MGVKMRKYAKKSETGPLAHPSKRYILYIRKNREDPTMKKTAAALLALLLLFASLCPALAETLTITQDGTA